LVQGFGPIVHTGFTDSSSVTEYRDTFSYDKVKLGKFIAGLHNRGVRVIGRGLWYISAAHTEAEIDHAVNAAREVLGTI
jgi:glutamate-1-semialdehyde 2,1-aminomutase